MMKNTAQFLEAARTAHGDQFDYSYIEQPTVSANKIQIRCRKHDYIFEQHPAKHKNGQNGCKYCTKRGLTTEDFIMLAQHVHGDRFDYSTTQYTAWNKHVTVTCREHGDFITLPKNHVDGRISCSICNGQRPIDRATLLHRIEELFPQHFDTSYIPELAAGGIHQQVIVRCLLHDQFCTVSAWSFMNGSNPCIYCNAAATGYDKAYFLNKAAKVVTSGEYDYAYIDFDNIDAREVQQFRCVTHDIMFWQTPDAHFTNRRGCPDCAAAQRLTSFEEFQQRVNTTHGAGRYGFDKTDRSSGITGNVTLYCFKHEAHFTYSYFNVLQGREGCLKCRTSGVSTQEHEVAEYIAYLGFTVERQNRSILNGKEIDIFIPELNIGFEYNGGYWHSDAFIQDTQYHFNKWRNAADAGVQLYTIWSDDWQDKRSIVEHFVHHVLNFAHTVSKRSENIVVQEIAENIAQDFLQTYHVQGAVSSNIHMGAFDEATHELVAVASFQQQDNTTIELTRYAYIQHTADTLQKMLTHCIELYPGTSAFHTIIDLSYDTSIVYEQSGWILQQTLLPEYTYLFRGRRYDEHSILTTSTEDMQSLPKVYDVGKNIYTLLSYSVLSKF